MAIKDYGPIVTWDLKGSFSKESSQNFVDTYMKPYLRVAKNCTNSASDDCDYNVRYLNGDTPEDGYDFDDDNPVKFVLADGSMLNVQVENWLDTGDDLFATVLVDINGHKKPNVYGKDVFVLRYQLIHNGASSGQVRFPGNVTNATTGNTSNFYCNKASDGRGCGRLILQNGWKIPTKEQFVGWGGSPDKYPW